MADPRRHFGTPCSDVGQRVFGLSLVQPGTDDVEPITAARLVHNLRQAVGALGIGMRHSEMPVCQDLGAPLVQRQRGGRCQSAAPSPAGLTSGASASSASATT
jgi:hypothetical protein